MDLKELKKRSNELNQIVQMANEEALLVKNQIKEELLKIIENPDINETQICLENGLTFIEFLYYKSCKN